ncbi:hypothetical protein EI94DRAFT_1726553 [Lactarius quietus]|nr:hypothetical protein EI94DRAFT_1726553 [Lactarius quietus]
MTLASFTVPYCFALFVCWGCEPSISPVSYCHCCTFPFIWAPQWIRRLFGEVWRCKKSLTFCLGILFPRKKNDLVKN